MPHPWEPEETVGTLWHRFVTRAPAQAAHPEAAVTLEALRPRLGLMFRGLGGAPGTEIAAATRTILTHRRSFWRRLGHAEEALALASFDGLTLRLPASADTFAASCLNEGLYFWLAAWAAFEAGDFKPCAEGLQGDVAAVRHCLKRR